MPIQRIKRNTYRYKKGGLIQKFQNPSSALPYQRVYTGDFDKLTFKDGDPLNAYLKDEKLEGQDMGDYYEYKNSSGTNMWTVPKSKLENKSEQTPQQRLGNYWRNSPFKGLDNIFANLMTLGYASTAEDGVKDINNGDYISGGLKILSPLAYGSGRAASLVGKAGDIYDLIGPDGVPKTFREFKNGNYKAGLTSLAGDLFNYFGPDKLNHEMENGNHFKSFIAGGKEGYDKINSFQPDNNIKITASVRDNSNNGNNNLL